MVVAIVVCLLSFLSYLYGFPGRDANFVHFRRIYFFLLSLKIQGFPGGTVVKNPPANAGDTGSSPGLGRSHMPQSN